jgi:hypothetical protein
VAHLAQQNVNGSPNIQALTAAILNSQQLGAQVKQDQRKSALKTNINDILVQNDELIQQLVSNPEMLNSAVWLNMNPLMNLTLVSLIKLI